MKCCKYHKSESFDCGSYAFNLQHEGIDQGDLCDVHFYKQQRDELLAVLKELRDAEWMMSHDYGGDRAAINERVEAAIAKVESK